jgi:hypothetical protein
MASLFSQSWFLAELVPRLSLPNIVILAGTCRGVYEALSKARQVDDVVEKGRRFCYDRFLRLYFDNTKNTRYGGLVVVTDPASASCDYVLPNGTVFSRPGSDGWTCDTSASDYRMVGITPFNYSTERRCENYTGGTRVPVENAIENIERSLARRARVQFVAFIDEPFPLGFRYPYKKWAYEAHDGKIEEEIKKDRLRFIERVFRHRLRSAEKVALLGNDFSKDLWKRVCTPRDVIYFGL